MHEVHNKSTQKQQFLNNNQLCLRTTLIQIIFNILLLIFFMASYDLKLQNQYLSCGHNNTKTLQ